MDIEKKPLNALGTENTMEIEKKPLNALGTEKKAIKIEKEENKEDQDLLLQELETFKSLAFKKICWYPDDLVWELNLDKTKLKRTKLLDKVHEYMQKATDAGLITRQELVSMIPPLLLDIKSSDIIFDMCAAPGSKTAQMLELLYSDEKDGKGMTKGGVIANDADFVRAYMLIHQIQRISTAGMVVLNHAAQFFPTLNTTTFELNNIGKYDNRFYFDKILADVPCSGDGAIRKLPNKWLNWHTQDGMCLHQLQSQILLRGLNLLKVNGYLLYSTCSINPIEDEAVVTEVFRKCSLGSFELIDVHEKLPGFIGRKGLVNWPIWEKIGGKTNEKKEEIKENEELFRKHKNFKEYMETMKGIEIPGKHPIIKASMFPEDEEFMRKIVQIEKTMRVLPHDQNTGGFYLALFKKLKPIVLTKPFPETTTSIKKLENLEDKKEDKTEEIINNEELIEDSEAMKVIEKLNKEEEIGENKEVMLKAKKNSFQPDKNSKKAKVLWKPLENEEYDWIRDYYGLSNDFPREQLIYMMESGPKKILLISEAIRKILDFDTKQVLNKINLGVKAFARNKEGFSKNFCRYRICQDSIVALFPFISKRKIKCQLADFKFILEKKNLRHDEIKNEELRQELKDMNEGSVVLYLEGGKDAKMAKDVLVCQNFTKTITIMCSKELYGSFYIKYF